MRANKERMYHGFQLDSRGRFNGKDLGHWHAKAEELVMQCLISAMNVDTRSLVGHLAHEQLKSLAQGVNPLLYLKVLDDIARIKFNMAQTLASILPAEPGSAFCKKHMPKAEKARRKRRKKAQKENRVDPLD